MDFYAAYPMTPASSLIEVITTNKDVVFYQGEDEIACSIAMLGAKFAGKRAMT
jgi:2-oxoglutarate ferredoxin oxidoreductase subunit alpha